MYNGACVYTILLLLGYADAPSRSQSTWMFLVACGPSGKVNAFMDFRNFIACPRCGDRVPATAQFCGNCGLSMQATMQGQRPSQVPPAAPPYTAGPFPAPPTSYSAPTTGPNSPPALQQTRFWDNARTHLTGSWKSIRRRMAHLVEQIKRPGTAAAHQPPDPSSGPMPQSGTPVVTPLLAPPGPAPNRAIVPAINRSPAESVVGLPPIQVGSDAVRLTASPPSREVIPAPPRETPPVSHAAPVLIPRPQPDGKGAPLPRNQKQFRRRVIAVCLVVVLVLAGAGLVVDHLLAPVKDPTLIDPTRLGAFPATSALAASSLPFQTDAAEENQISTEALPPTSAKAAALVKEPPSTLASRVLTLNGLGQSDMGIDTPVDLSVAANAQYVIEAVDGGFQVATTQGKGLRLGFVQFFSPLLHAGDVFGEPRVIFDPTSERWVLVVDEITTDLGNINASYFDIGISTTKSPLGLWHVYQIPTQSNEFGNCNWADDPQVGSNAVGFFIAGSIFTCGTGGELLGVVLWELPKSAFLNGKSVPPLRWVGFTNSFHQPLLSLVPAIEAGSTSTEWLVGNDAGDVDDGTVSNTLSLWAVVPTSSPGAATTLPYTTVSLSSAYADPPQALQPNPAPQDEQSSPRLSTGDARVTSAQFINGQIYAAFTTAVNWPGDTSTRSGIYWLDLAPSISSQTNNVSAQLVQAGILGQPGTYLFTPALAADAEGDVVLSAQISAFGLNPGIIYTSRRSGDPSSQMGQGNSIVLLQAGAGPFGAHWGDYMGSSLVIYDSNHVWPKVWIAAPVIDPSDQSDELASSWHTSVWEFDTGGSALENIS